MKNNLLNIFLIQIKVLYLHHQTRTKRNKRSYLETLKTIQMKNNLRRLKFILSIFGDAFYVCSISDYNVNLQGKYKPETVLKAKELRFTTQIDANGYIYMTRYDYQITLTN